MSDYHVFFLGQQADHVGQGHPDLLAAQAAAQVDDRRVDVGQAPLGASERGAQPLDAYRLEQVIHRIELESLERMGVVGRAEDHPRPSLPDPALGHRDAVDARHVDVQQHDVRLQFADGRQRTLAVAERADHLGVIAFPQERGEPCPRQGFVVDDQDATHARAPGRCSATTNCAPCASARMVARAP